MSAKKNALQLRFNRQNTHKADTETSPETRIGIDVKSVFFSIDHTVPEKLFVPVFVFFQFQPESDLIDVLYQTILPSLLRFQILLDDDADFGVMQ